MPPWVLAALIAAVAVFVAWWAEDRVSIIITELKAIRENLDKLWADRTEEEEAGNSGTRARETAAHKGD
jgi:hypothetical protein